jgi:hypothetical protein
MSARPAVRRPVVVAALSAAALVLTGCGSSSSTSQETTAASSGAPSVEPSDSGTSAQPAEDGAAGDTAHTLVKSGFGVSNFGAQDEYAWVSALVRNDSDNSGATVIVNFNLLDAAGNIITSASQTEAFSRPDELLVLGTQVEVPAGSSPTSLEATAQVQYPGIGPTEPFPELPVGPVTVAKEGFGGYVASAVLSNPTADPLNSPRVGVICLNAAGAIIGGSSIFPDLVPPDGQVKVSTSSLIVSGEPASCEMYAGAPL